MKVPMECYTGELLFKRFSYTFFKEKMNRVGNIISFVSPLNMKSLLPGFETDECIGFCGEILEINAFGGVTFFKLFQTYLAQIISEEASAEVEIDNVDIIVKKDTLSNHLWLKQGVVNINQWNHVDDSFLFFVGLINKAGKINETRPTTIPLNLNAGSIDKLIEKTERMFYTTTHSIFIESSK